MVVYQELMADLNCRMIDARSRLKWHLQTGGPTSTASHVCSNPYNSNRYITQGTVRVVLNYFLLSGTRQEYTFHDY